MSVKKKLENNIISGWMDMFYLCVLILLFGYFCIFHETVELGDSFQYIHHQPMRDPVYSLVLQLLMWMFKDAYGIALRIIQNIMAVVCLYYSYIHMSRDLKLPAVFKFGTGVLLLVPHVITPLISQSGMIMTNSVLTEGFALSLYYVWFAWLIEIIVCANQDTNIGRTAVKSLLLSLLLSMIRGQMIVCLVMWLIVVTYACIAMKQAKKIAVCFAGLIVAVIFKSVFTGCYNYIENGFYTSTISTSPMMLANVVYVTELDDLPQDENDDMLECYRLIVEEANLMGLTRNEGDGWLANALHHEEVHEEINFTYIENNVRMLIFNRYGVDHNEYYRMRIIFEDICSQMTKTYMPMVAGKYIKNYISMAMLGMVRSVAIEQAHLWIYAVLIYVLAVLLTVVALFRNKRCPAAYVMIAVIICIGGTVCGTCLAIQCISRYMMYNLPLFYIAGMALISSLGKGKE